MISSDRLFRESVFIDGGVERRSRSLLLDEAAVQDSVQAPKQAGRRLRRLTETGEERTARRAIRPGWLFFLRGRRVQGSLALALSVQCQCALNAAGSWGEARVVWSFFAGSCWCAALCCVSSAWAGRREFAGVGAPRKGWSRRLTVCCVSSMHNNTVDGALAQLAMGSAVLGGPANANCNANAGKLVRGAARAQDALLYLKDGWWRSL